MAKITGELFAKALEQAGVVTDLNTVSRIVIDIRAGKPLMLHVQRIGDERMIDLASLLVDGDD